MATTKRVNKGPAPSLPDDEDRQRALCVPFRERSVNQEHYDSKMKFWQDIIAKFCEHKGDATFTIQEVQTAFTQCKRSPACLHDVLTQMVQSKVVRLRADYEYDPQNSWAGWAVNSFVRKPFSWGLTKVKTSVGLADERTQNSLVQYVYLGVMQTFCDWLQTRVLQPNQGKLLHYDDFKALCENAGVDLTYDCLHLALHTLHRQHKIGLEYTDATGKQCVHLIKIPTQGQSSVIITEADRAVHNLQMTQANLVKQLEAVEEDIKVNENKAREYLKDNKRQLAKTYLRKKHLLEKVHEKRSVALHNIELLLSSVDEAQSNGDILDSYKIGSKALQDALNSSGLKYDNVDEVVSNVRESVDAHNEVQDLLGNVSLSDNLGLYENDDLERELQEILGEPTSPSATAHNNNDSNVLPKPKGVPITNVESNNNNSQTNVKKTVTITDAQLLAMLADLEVEDKSIRSDSYSEHENCGEGVDRL